MSSLLNQLFLTLGSKDIVHCFFDGGHIGFQYGCQIAIRLHKLLPCLIKMLFQMKTIKLHVTGSNYYHFNFAGGHFEIEDGGQNRGRITWFHQFSERARKTLQVCQFSHFLQKVNDSGEIQVLFPSLNTFRERLRRTTRLTNQSPQNKDIP